MSTQLTEQQKNNVRLWCETLESGKYKQGKVYLRAKNDEYCCWGVACEIFQDKIKSAWYLTSSNYSICGLKFSPPEEINDILVSNEVPVNLLEDISKVFPIGHTFSLTSFNDRVNLTFKQIAAILRFAYLNEPLTDPEKVNDTSQ